MRWVRYAGGDLLTGDRIAEVVLRYAAALARIETSATLEVPGRAPGGEADTFLILLGPASQLLAEPAEDDPHELVDEEFVARVEQEIERIARPPQALPFSDDTLPPPTAIDDL